MKKTGAILFFVLLVLTGCKKADISAHYEIIGTYSWKYTLADSTILATNSTDQYTLEISNESMVIFNENEHQLKDFRIREINYDNPDNPFLEFRVSIMGGSKIYIKGDTLEVYYLPYEDEKNIYVKQ